MRKKVKVITIIIMFFIVTELFSYRVLQRKVEKGNYIPRILLNAGSLRSMPIPKTRENYAVLQSIGHVTNILVGEFLTGDGKITLYRDSNQDGKVDYVARLFQATNKVQYLPLPTKFCPPEKFKSMKIKILNGNWDSTLFPNREGGPYIKKIISGNSTVKKWRHGFRILEYDPDDKSKIRTSFFFEYKEKHGASAVFDIKYHHMGRIDLSPIVNIGVYSKNSKDPIIIQYMKDLSKYTRKNILM
jgi:hypothetical protein